MAIRDHARLCLIVAVFLVAALFLVPQLTGDHPVEVGRPGAGNDKEPAEWNDKNEPSQSDGSVAISTSEHLRPTSLLSPIPIPSLSPDPSPVDTETPGSPATLNAGQTLAPFHLASPSGRFEFSLLASGSLSLLDTKTDTELFTSDTDYYWPVTWQAELTQDAVLKLSWSHETEEPRHATPWVSKLLPDCDPISSPAEAPVLELLDSGLLHIRVGAKSTCVLNRAIDDKGRVAIVYTGFLRTYLQTCEDQNKKLVESWTGTGGADVHVFAYEEEVYHLGGDPVTKESINKHLKSCFGDALKTVEIAKLKDVQESVKAPAKALLEQCDAGKLDRHLSQWKALYLAGQQVQKYMVENGVMYDYIYKGRLDLKLWGEIPPLSSQSVPQNGILAPRVALDWTWYAMLHDGELRAGVTDITAFGRPNAMFTYLALYREFIHLRTLEKEAAKWKGFNTKQWIKDSAGQEGCTPEGILAYWLRLNGISVKTDWRFDMGLLRGDGTLIFTCPTAGRDWMCPGFIPHAHDDGTLY